MPISQNILRLLGAIPLPAFLLMGSAAPLLFALFVEYGLKYPPCHFCLLQRYAYLLPLVSGLLALTLLRRTHPKMLLSIAMLGWAAGLGLALWHSGIEQGWVGTEGGCSAASLGTGSLDDLRAQIMNAPLVACNIISIRFLGLSMTVWNALATLGFLVLAGYYWRRVSPKTKSPS
jgi:disulfide bond formation protein DsbB